VLHEREIYRSCKPICLIPVAARSKAWVCGRLLAGIAGSNPAGAWMSFSCERHVLSGIDLRRADYLSRGVIPSVMYLSVIAKPR